MKTQSLLFLIFFTLLCFTNLSLSQTNLNITSAEPIIEKINILQQKSPISDTIITIFVNFVFISGLIYSFITLINLFSLKNENKNCNYFFTLISKLKLLRLIFGILILSGLLSFMINFLKLFSVKSGMSSSLYILLNSDINFFKTLNYAVFCGLVIVSIYLFLELIVERKYKNLNNK